MSHLSCCGNALITGFVEGFHFSFLLWVFFLEWIIYRLIRQHKHMFVLLFHQMKMLNSDKNVSLFINNPELVSRHNLLQISSAHVAQCSRGGRCSVPHLHWRTWSLSHNTLNRDCVHLLQPWHSKPDRKNKSSYFFTTVRWHAKGNWAADIIYLPIFAK